MLFEKEPKQVDWAVATRVQPARDVVIKWDLPGLIINPAVVVSGEVTVKLSTP